MSEIQDERRKLMNEVFDSYDPDNLGYIFSKDALKILAAMGRVLEPEDETDFLSMIDPKNEGRVTKKIFWKVLKLCILYLIIICLKLLKHLKHLIKMEMEKFW